MSYKEPNDEFFINLAQGIVTAAVIVWITMQLTGCASNTKEDVEIKKHQYHAHELESKARAAYYRTKKETVSVSLICKEENSCGKGLNVTATYNDPRENTFVSTVPDFQTSGEGSTEVAKVYSRPIETILSGAVTGMAIIGVAKVVGENAGSGNTQSHITTYGDDGSQSSSNTPSTHNGTITDNSQQNQGATGAVAE